MAANVYECMFILDSCKVAGNLETADKQIRAILEKNNAEVLVCRLWDERKFTYPIKNQKKGIYYLTYFSSEGKNLVTIEHDCSLNEMIMRQLILRDHPKLVRDDAVPGQGGTRGRPAQHAGRANRRGCGGGGGRGRRWPAQTQRTSRMIGRFCRILLVFAASPGVRYPEPLGFGVPHPRA